MKAFPHCKAAVSSPLHSMLEGKAFTGLLHRQSRWFPLQKKRCRRLSPAAPLFFTYSSSLRTAKNASVGTCTVPRERIRFLSPLKIFHFEGPPHLTQTGRRSPPVSRFCPTAAKRLYAASAAARCRSQRAKSYSSSLRTAKNASVGTCTVPRERIRFLPSFCFSSSFFFRVTSPP